MLKCDLLVENKRTLFCSFLLISAAWSCSSVLCCSVGFWFDCLRLFFVVIFLTDIDWITFIGFGSVLRVWRSENLLLEHATTYCWCMLSNPQISFQVKCQLSFLVGSELGAVIFYDRRIKLIVIFAAFIFFSNSIPFHGAVFVLFSLPCSHISYDKHI